MKYFIHINGQQQGPFEEKELLLHNVSTTTMVWCEGMPNWAPAGQVQALSYLFQSQAQSSQQGYQQPIQPQPQYTQPQQFNFQPSQKPLMPETYLVWAILTTLFCCLPFGIVSIVKASQVSSAYNAGNYAQAEKNSQDAKKWAKWSAIIGLLGGLIYLIILTLTGIFVNI